MNVPTFQSVELINLDYYVNIYQQLHSLKLSKPESWEKCFSLLEWNQKNHFFQYQQIQKLWIKLIKKYKFKFTDWEKLNSPCNLHAFLIDKSGHGLQNLIRFYQDRNLTQWKVHAFEFGLDKLLYEQQYTHLEIYFLTQVICEKWARNYHLAEAFTAYYEEPKCPKTKELYDAFICYQLKSESGARLYAYLTAYNPHYQIAAKNTPSFYKELHNQLQHATL